ncbi:MAG: hypothetical protein B6D41_01080 [Chloroflexi bacterium UTCFX4]|nr:MAG: hypothetical protein B6D41_01080 [Chloroflexi bacterium UTCFX4]
MLFHFSEKVETWKSMQTSQEVNVFKETDFRQVKCVIVDGPYSGGISEDIGDEIPEWVVALCDDDSSDIETHTCATYESAMELGKLLAREMKIELIIEAMRA